MENLTRVNCGGNFKFPTTIPALKILLKGNLLLFTKIYS